MSVCVCVGRRKVRSDAEQATDSSAHRVCVCGSWEKLGNVIRISRDRQVEEAAPSCQTWISSALIRTPPAFITVILTLWNINIQVITAPLDLKGL